MPRRRVRDVDCLRLRAVRHEARKLFTYRSGNALDSKSIDGAIVRFEPKVDATADDIAVMKKWLFDQGAKAVKVMPKPPTKKLVAGSNRVAIKSGDTIRQVVMARLKSANTNHRQRLEELLSETLTKSGA